jgi:Big-like domain-containing protein
MSGYQGCSDISNRMSLGALVLLALLAGCGGGGPGNGDGGGGGGGGGPPDSDAPTVTAMTPGENSTVLGTNSKLTATLSEAMIPDLINFSGPIDPATGIPAKFRLTDGATFLSGAVSYDATNHIAVFTPTVALVPGQKYTATIITGIKDLSGNPLTTDFAWCFEASAGRDTTPPGATFTDAAANVAVNRRITATFSKDMDAFTITPASFTVTGPGATAVSGTATYLARTAVFRPSADLLSSTLYTATIAAGVRDLAGNASPANVTWSFTTGAGADVTAPVVNSTNPTANESGVGISRTISVTLSEPMDPATITTATFLVSGPGAAPVMGTVAFNASNNTATFTRLNHSVTPGVCEPTPASWLEPNTTYTAALTTGAKDMAGNALASNLVWSFTTGANP